MTAIVVSSQSPQTPAPSSTSPPCVTISTTQKSRRGSRGFGLFTNRHRQVRSDISKIDTTKVCSNGSGSNNSIGTMKTVTTTTTTTANTTASSSNNDKKNSSSSSSSNQKKSKLLDFFTRVGKNRTSNAVKKDNKNQQDKVIGGVYIVPSSPTMTTTSSSSSSSSSSALDSPLGGGLGRTTSCRTIDARSSTSADDATAVSNWSPSDGPDFHKGAPIIARRPSGVKTDPRLADLDDQMLLSHVMFEARKLPRSPGPYASAHVLINSERQKRTVQPLRRCPAMDEIARRQAKVMAQAGKLQHTEDPVELQDEIVDIIHKIENKNDDDDSVDGTSAVPEKRQDHRVGENIWRGQTIKDIHHMMMKNASQRNNIIHRRWVYMGVGTAKGEDGLLYLCQIFSS
mmetsp:Transcript_57122/g.139221  ORF Transcript_57122/g.139221 Transcript_57122/m.139221 type:complete len:399 (-) Transcript_57122:53-1249(-)